MGKSKFEEIKDALKNIKKLQVLYAGSIIIFVAVGIALVLKSSDLLALFFFAFIAVLSVCTIETMMKNQKIDFINKSEELYEMPKTDIKGIVLQEYEKYGVNGAKKIEEITIETLYAKYINKIMNEKD